MKGVLKRGQGKILSVLYPSIREDNGVNDSAIHYLKSGNKSLFVKRERDPLFGSASGLQMKVRLVAYHDH